MVALTDKAPPFVVWRVFPVMVAPVVPGFTTSHVMVWKVAFPGCTVPVSNNGLLATPAVGTSVISVTGIVSTYISKVCEYGKKLVVPFLMRAITVTVPPLVVWSVFPVIVAPVVPGLFTLQIIPWLVALLGNTVPVSVSGMPAVAVVGRSVMLFTGINVLQLIFCHLKWGSEAVSQIAQLLVEVPISQGAALQLEEVL